MEFARKPRHLSRIATYLGSCLLRDVLCQNSFLLRLETLRYHPDDGSFNGAAGGEDLTRLSGRRLRDRRTAVRLDRDQPLESETRENLATARAADPENLPHPAFAEACSGWQLLSSACHVGP